MVLEVLARAFRQEKVMKGTRLKRAKYFYWQESAQNVLKLMNGFNKDAGYKINKQKSVEFPSS